MLDPIFILYIVETMKKLGNYLKTMQDGNIGFNHSFVLPKSRRSSGIKFHLYCDFLKKEHLPLTLRIQDEKKNEFLFE